MASNKRTMPTARSKKAASRPPNSRPFRACVDDRKPQQPQFEKTQPFPNRQRIHVRAGPHRSQNIASDSGLSFQLWSLIVVSPTPPHSKRGRPP